MFTEFLRIAHNSIPSLQDCFQALSTYNAQEEVAQIQRSTAEQVPIVDLGRMRVRCLCAAYYSAGPQLPEG